MSEETYREKCQDSRIQDALKWEPKVGDWHLTHNYTEPRICRLPGYCIGNKKLLSWLPTSDDLVERLRNELWMVKHFGPTGSCAEYFVLNLDDRIPDHSEAEFGASSFDEALLLAFGWVNGLEWKQDHWEERRSL